MNDLHSDPLSHLAVTEWDRHFLSNSDYRTWLQQELHKQPIHPGEALAEYVDRRTHPFSPASPPSPQTATTTTTATSSQPQPQQQQQQLSPYNASAVVSLAPEAFYVDPVHLSPQQTYHHPHLQTSDIVSNSNNKGRHSQASAGIDPSSVATAKPTALPPPRTLMVRPQKSRSNSPAAAAPSPNTAASAVASSSSSSSAPTSAPAPAAAAAAAAAFINTPPVDSPDAAPSPATPAAAVAAATAAAAHNDLAASNESWHRIRPQVLQQLEASNSKFVVRSANTLAKCLHPFSDSASPATMVPPDGRRLVLDTLLKRATKEFYHALVQIQKGREVFESWCHDAVLAGKKATYNKPLLDTLKPCLLLLKKMPYKFEEVTNSKLGLPKTLAVASKRDIYPADCRELAQQLVADWKDTFRSREQAQQARQEEAKRKGGAANLEDARKKRKVSPPSAAAPASAPAPASKTSSTAATPAPKPSLSNLIGSKTGGALKGLSIGKGGAAAAAGSGSASGAAGSSSSTGSRPATAGGFASILASLSGGSNKSNPTAQKPGQAAPSTAGPSSIGQGVGVSSAPAASGSGTGSTKGTGLLKRPGANHAKKKKFVRWKEDADLVAVREIEPAVYDEDHMEGGLDLRAMEANEGKLMIHRTDEETRPWKEPPGLALPPLEGDAPLYPPLEPLFPLGQSEGTLRHQSGSDSIEIDPKAADHSMDDEEDDLHTPAEPSEEEDAVGPASTDAAQCRPMQNHESMVSDPEYQAQFRKVHPPLMEMLQSNAVSKLLEEMQRTASEDYSRPPPQASFGSESQFGPSRSSHSTPYRYDPPQPYPPPTPSKNRDAYNHSHIQSNRASSGGGRGSKGPPPLPYKKTPCSYYAQGHCVKGDRCTFLH